MFPSPYILIYGNPIALIFIPATSPSTGWNGGLPPHLAVALQRGWVVHVAQEDLDIVAGRRTQRFSQGKTSENQGHSCHTDSSGYFVDIFLRYFESAPSDNIQQPPHIALAKSAFSAMGPKLWTTCGNGFRKIMEVDFIKSWFIIWESNPTDYHGDLFNMAGTYPWR